MSEQVVCDGCGILVDRNKYERHIKYGHKDKRDHVCELCHKKFSSLYNLHYHMAHHANARNFLCNECPRAYNTAADLAQHQRIHEKQRDPYKCELCGLQFQIRSRYNTHLRTHKIDQRGPKECNICKKMFVCLSSHNRIVHMNLRKYDCDLCDKKFGKKSGLDRHFMTVHQKQKNFMCDLCDKAFGEKAQLKKHKRTHSNIDDSTFCLICCENFKNIREHYEKNHQNLKNVCQNCFKRFSRRQELEVHLKKCHRILQHLLFCDCCNKIFSNKLLLKRHLKIHKGIPKTSKINEEIEFNCSVQDSESELNLNNNETERIFVDILVPEIKIEDTQDHLNTEDDILMCDNEIKKEIESDNEDIDQNYIYNVNQENNLLPDKLQFDKSNQRFKAEKQMIEMKIDEKTCKYCDKTFMKERNLKIHIQAIHSDNKFECELCFKVFSFKSAKERHLKVVHYNQKQHQCTVCEKSFGTRYDLKNHSNHYHNRNPEQRGNYHCEKCSKDFVSSSALSRHQKGVHENIKQKGPRDYRCRICREVLANKYQKEKHMAQVHLDGRKIKRSCGFCKMEYQYFADFRDHIESHKDISICITCGKSFTNAEEYYTHVECHKKIDVQLRRFICDICGHKLFNKIQLNVHMRKHVKETNFYVCDVCGQSYKFIAPFLYHKKLHSGIKEFICTYCSKEFLRKQDLIVHTRQHTKEKPYTCRVCDKKFSQKQVLNTHLQIHSTTRITFACIECNISFTDKTQLRCHEEQTHPEKRPFRCFMCNMSFKHEHNLRAHKNYKHKAFINDDDIKIEFPTNSSIF